MEEFNFSLLELEKNPGFLLEKNIQQVTISDAEFSSDKNRFVKLIKLIEKQVPEVHFTFYISPSIIDKEIVENLSSIACTLQIDFLTEYLGEKRKFFSKKIRLLNDYGLVFGFNIDSANFPTIKSFKNALDEAINYYPNHIYINNEKFEKFHGNGINVSTSTGSTGYNKSLNGPVIHPYNQVLIFGEVAPINNRVYQAFNSFLVLRDVDQITLKGDFSNVLIGGDTNLQTNDVNDEIKIRLSEKAFIFAYYKSLKYYRNLRDSFIK